MIEAEEMTSVRVHTDLTVEELVKIAVKNNEGVLADNQALAVKTGAFTGRSPKQRRIVANVDHVNWGEVNIPLAPEHFERAWEQAKNYIATKESYVSHLWVGSDPDYQLPVKVQTEYAWHNLFVKQLFIRPTNLAEVKTAYAEKGWTILCVPGLYLTPPQDGTHEKTLVALNFADRKVLIAGTGYAGEMKKAMFTVLNYLLPAKNVLPMHCSANVGTNGEVALFFGLSGTGKTTLSADPERSLIGDDEHGWCKNGIFNLEGGCYAKCINLSKEKEPMIWDAIQFGAVMENVILNANGTPDYNDSSLTENTRVAYPREFISPRVEANRAGHPKHVIFLTCDLYGVLPPVSVLTREQAAYHFLSGYTALVGSTELGSTAGIKPTFSTCFGAPFFPREPKVYAELLMHWLEQTGAQVYLVNTGWTGGSYGVGSRFSIPTTRSIIRAVLNGDVAKAELQTLPGFNLQIPTNLPGIESNLLNPREAWKDSIGYDKAVKELAEKFVENFKRFQVTEAIRAAGPQVK